MERERERERPTSTAASLPLQGNPARCKARSGTGHCTPARTMFRLVAGVPTKSRKKIFPSLDGAPKTRLVNPSRVIAASHLLSLSLFHNANCSPLGPGDCVCCFCTRPISVGTERLILASSVWTRAVIQVTHMLATAIRLKVRHLLKT